MSRTRKRTDIPTSWNSNRVSKPRFTTTKKTRNSKLLSGHTNTDNKTLSFCVSQMQITTTSLAPYHKVWRANDPYDPDYALGGESAYGFGVMATRYSKYYTKSAKLKILSAGYNNTKAQLLCAVWADSTPTGSYAGINQWIGVCKANGGKVFTIPHVLAQSKTLPTLMMKTKDIHRGGIGDEDNSSKTDTNPVNEIFFHMIIYPVGVQDFEAGTGDINISLSIEYETLFYDPKDIL